MTRRTKKEEKAMGCVGLILIIMIFAIIYVIVTWWYIVLPTIAIMIGIIYFSVYRDKKEKIDDNIVRYNPLWKEIIARNKKDDNIVRYNPLWKEIIARNKKPCPNCNMELSVWNKCELCGWKKEICRRKALDKCGLVKMDENSCNGCGKYEKWDGEKQEEKRSRTIPKHIQREVWRRDQGKCIECGSQERLEFDHIIPFSKDGSNTTRNIQLLCENCNRKKSNKI